MPSQSRKHRGYKSQKILADYLVSKGWIYAESTGAGRSGTDVTGTIGIDWEVKARTGFSIGGVAPVAHAGPVLARATGHAAALLGTAPAVAAA